MLLSRLQNDLVDNPMEGIVWQVRNLLHSIPVVISFLGPFAKLATLRVSEGQNTRPACMKPVAWVLLAMTRCKPGSDGLRGAFMVGSICRVCMAVSAKNITHKYR